MPVGEIPACAICAHRAHRLILGVGLRVDTGCPVATVAPGCRRHLSRLTRQLGRGGPTVIVDLDAWALIDQHDLWLLTDRSSR